MREDESYRGFLFSTVRKKWFHWKYTVNFLNIFASTMPKSTSQGDQKWDGWTMSQMISEPHKSQNGVQRQKTGCCGGL